MPEWIKTILWILLLPAGLIALYLAVVILLGMITRYSPFPVENLDIPKPCSGSRTDADTLTLITWNLGYAGLGKEMDFFYEGGRQVRPGQELYGRYIHGILKMVAKWDTVDCFLFQEVDLQSRRSYGDNQVDRIAKQLAGFNTLFAMNYNVRFVPLPLARPMGNVRSGLLLASRYCPEHAQRCAFPPDESWPTRLFMLRRCFLKALFTLGNKQLTVIHTHHSAYDRTGEAKSVQLAMIRTEALKAYEEGGFVIAGGDWNQNPPGFDPDQVINGDMVRTIHPPIPADLMPPGWQWVYDPAVPTNRDVHEPYTKGATPTTIIDFFLVSPNIEVLEIRTIPLEFTFTDHQPVYMKVRLNGP